MKKVFVSGCYDLLHSGHIAFFKEASQYGELYVGLGSDKTIKELKGRETINSEEERLYIVKSIRYVKDAWINSGSDLMDFENDVRKFNPDIFIVNEDGNSPTKQKLCKELRIEYKILKRIPEPGLEARSTTDLRIKKSVLPYRLDIAGTWIDQPYVSKIHPGWAITISLEPIIEYNERSGMATSTRNAAKELWPFQLPLEKPEKLAEILFRYENTPGREFISGAQDSIGICIPGICRHYYNEKYWPEKIETCEDEDIIQWLEDKLYMITLWPRPDNLAVTNGMSISVDGVKKLTESSEKCWNAIMKKNLEEFGEFFKASFFAQISMFPSMINQEIEEVINQYKDEVFGYKLSGAGGGGYLVLISDKPIDGAMKLKIRRKDLTL